MLRRAVLLAVRAQRSQIVEACPACLATQFVSDINSSNRYLQRDLSLSRGYVKEAEADDSDDDTVATMPPNPRVQKLAEEILHLNLIEVADLTELLQKRLNISAPPFGGMMGGSMAGAPAVAPAAAAPSAAEEKEPEKTEFDVKLDGFDSASKIKVIKEIRGVTELGLKEAKELVEKSPVVVKSGLKKEEAEELKKKLEAVGGKVSLE